MKSGRRSAINKLFATLAGVTGVGLFNNSRAGMTEEKNTFSANSTQDLPFSFSTRMGNIVFLAGRGERLNGDIRVHTDNVLKIMEAELIKAGSSMEKVLKVTVFLENMKDFDGMNEIYRGRFGKNPPARTTVAVPNGLPPADNLIQMDCIAYI